jgi:hypothetical protein
MGQNSRRRGIRIQGDGGVQETRWKGNAGSVMFTSPSDKGSGGSTRRQPRSRNIRVQQDGGVQETRWKGNAGSVMFTPPADERTGGGAILAALGVGGAFLLALVCAAGLWTLEHGWWTPLTNYVDRTLHQGIYAPGYKPPTDWSKRPLVNWTADGWPCASGMCEGGYVSREDYDAAHPDDPQAAARIQERALEANAKKTQNPYLSAPLSQEGPQPGTARPRSVLPSEASTFPSAVDETGDASQTDGTATAPAPSQPAGSAPERSIFRGH